MIDQMTIDRIMDAANIVDVVSEFVTLRKRGVNYIGLCPFHADRTPSFSVSPSKGICKCFACGKGGNVVHFIMEHEQLSYYEALKWLAKKYNIEIKEKELTDEQKQNLNLRESLFVVNQFANQYFQQCAKPTQDRRNMDALLYFRSRGFRDDTIRKFQLGYCTPLPHAFSDFALKKGYKEEFLLQTGLCYQKDDGTLIDRFRGRVIFPVHTLSGKVVAFGGRVLNAATKGVQMKYVNSPESEIYHKSRELYGIYFAKQAIVRNDKCFLVEGYTDVISMHQSGVENVVSSSGTALTQEQIRMIHRFTSNITLLYDGDAAGIKASMRGIDMLLQEGMNVKVCLFPDGDDPDSFARKHNAAQFQEFIEKNEVDFIRFKANLLLDDAGKDPTKRVQLIGSMVDSISVIPDAISRSVYMHECSELLAVDERLLVSAVGDKLRKSVTAARWNTTVTSQKEDGYIPLPPDIEGTKSDVQQSSQTKPVSEEIIQPRCNNILLKQEKELIRMVVRYGEQIMCYVTEEDGNNTPLSVIECIAKGLKGDGLTFQYPLHKQMLEEAVNHLKNPNFIAEQYFVRHPNQQISEYAVSLATDRYHLSKYHSKAQHIETDEERLCEVVPMLLMDYKLIVVEDEMKHIQDKLATLVVPKDEQEIKGLMQRYMDLQNMKSFISKQAGDRIVVG